MIEAVEFYYREGCHLCEEMAAALFRGWPGRFDDMQWRDVDSRKEWRDRYGHRVPVLVLQGQVLCEFHLAPEVLIPHFGPPTNPL